MLLEAESHGDAVFITLTYAPENLPKEYEDKRGRIWKAGSLNRRHLQLFFKRLRRRCESKIRYFAVGEYGEQNTRRPHYHAIVYGLSPLEAEGVVDSSWGLGQIDVGTLTPASAQYVAGYVTKKLTNVKNEETQKILQGRHPEFSVMSNRPGIGAEYMKEVSATLRKAGKMGVKPGIGRVPSVLRIQGKKMPIGRYLKQVIRDEMGWKKETPEAERKEWLQEMRELRRKNREVAIDKKEKFKTTAQILVDENRQKVIGLEKKNKIWRKRETL